MILFPNAKINIGLNIVARRVDGYHEIETVFYPVPWCDILEIVPATTSQTTLTISGRQIDCPAEKNLVIKAYNCVAGSYDIPDVDIYLRKMIPDGAGLGGGSSDAAFTIKGLNEMFSLGMSDEEMAEMASTIGADCPFFIYNRPTYATGIGTTFTPIDLTLNDYCIVIVKPMVSVPTKEAYAGVTPAPPLHSLTSSITLPATQWDKLIVNDFEASIFPQHPIIKQIKDRLVSLGAVYASMSGSGSSVFGIFSGYDILAEDFQSTFPNYDIFADKLQ